MLLDKLLRILDLTNWDGDELRLIGMSIHHLTFWVTSHGDMMCQVTFFLLFMTGTSLGAQVALNLAAKLISETNYGPKVKRIALLDHYWSKNRKSYLPHIGRICVGYLCDHYSPGQYAREVLMKIIRDNDNPPVSV